MKYYLGTPFAHTFFTKAMLETGGTGNVLFTYAEKRDAKEAIACLRPYENFDIIIDSGAFSAWNSGKTIDRSELLNYYKALKLYRPDLNFINLDVIPGKRGFKPSIKEAQEACEQGWQNYMWFKANGIDVLPVFHEDDPWKYLQMMKDSTDFIAISPANDSSTSRRILWLDAVYADLKANYKTHGLAATAEPLLKRYPFFSVDSINWKAGLLYGRSHLHDDRITSALGHSSKMKQYVLEKEIEYFKRLQEEITYLWRKRGISWP